MPSTQQLREQRANLWSQMTEIMEIADRDNGGALTGEQSKKYDSLEKDLDAKGDEIARAERFEQRSTELNKVDRRELAPLKEDENGTRPKAKRKVDTAEYASAFESYIRGGVMDLAAEAARPCATAGSRTQRSRTRSASAPPPPAATRCRSSSATRSSSG
jgi:HK97 family phage major capsid protein